MILMWLLRLRPMWYSHKDSINVTSVLHDCVGRGAATSSVLISTEGLFISGLSGSRALLALCSGAEIYSMARGRRVTSATMAELCLNRVDFTQGLIVARRVWATQLRHSSWCRGSSVSALDEVAVHTQIFFCVWLDDRLCGLLAQFPHFGMFSSRATTQCTLIYCRLENGGPDLLYFSDQMLLDDFLCRMITSYKQTTTNLCRAGCCLRNRKVMRRANEVSSYFHSLLEQPQQPSLHTTF